MDLLRTKIDKITLLNKQEKMYELLKLHPFKRFLFSLFFVMFGIGYGSLFLASTSSPLISFSYVMLSYISLLVVAMKTNIISKSTKASGLNLLEYTELLNYEILSGKRNIKFHEYVYYFLSVTSLVMIVMQIGELLENIRTEKRLKIDYSKIVKEKEVLIKEMLQDKETVVYLIKNKFNLKVMPRSKDYIINLINDKYLTAKEQILVANADKEDSDLNIYFLEQNFEKEKYIPSMKKEKSIKIQNN